MPKLSGFFPVFIRWIPNISDNPLTLWDHFDFDLVWTLKLVQLFGNTLETLRFRPGFMLNYSSDSGDTLVYFWLFFPRPFPFLASSTALWSFSALRSSKSVPLFRGSSSASSSSVSSFFLSAFLLPQRLLRPRRPLGSSQQCSFSSTQRLCKASLSRFLAASFPFLVLATFRKVQWILEMVHSGLVGVTTSSTYVFPRRLWPRPTDLWRVSMIFCASA